MTMSPANRLLLFGCLCAMIAGLAAWAVTYITMSSRPASAPTSVVTPLPLGPFASEVVTNDPHATAHTEEGSADAVDADDPVILIGVAKAHIALDELDKAKSYLLRVRPPRADSTFLLGWIAMRRHEFDQAAELIRESLREETAHAVRWHTLAAVERVRDRPIDALAAIDRAIELDDERAEHRMMRASILFDISRYAEVLEEIERSQERGATGQEVIELRGLALAKLGRVQEAEAILSPAFANQPSARVAWALVDIWEGRRDWPRIVEMSDRMESQEPDRASFWRTQRSLSYWQAALDADERGDLEESIKQIRLSVQTEPTNENRALLVNRLSAKLLELLEESRFAEARTLAIEIGRHDVAESIELGRLIDQQEGAH